jgi:hypothetical protein
MSIERIISRRFICFPLEHSGLGSPLGKVAALRAAPW